MTDKLPENDLEGRVADLKAREVAAGGPEALVSSLASGLSKLRRYVLIASIGLVLDIALSVVAVLTVLSLQHSEHSLRTAVGQQAVNTTDIASNRNVAYRDCLASNSFKATDKALWEFYLTQPNGLDGTPADVATRAHTKAAMEVYLAKTFKPVVCKP